MALWDERIGASPAWAAVERANERFDELLADHPADEGLGRGARVIAAAEARLKALDPDLARAKHLDALGSRINALVDTIENQLRPPDPNAGTIPPEKVASDTDNVVEMLLELPAGEEEAVSVAEVFREQLASVERKVRAIVEQAQSSITEAVDESTAILAKRDEQATAIGARLSDVEAQLDTMRTTIEEFIDQQKDAAARAAQNAAAEHSVIRDEGRQSMKAAVDAAKEEFAAEAKREKDEHADLVASLSKQAQSVLDAIKEKKDQVERLAGAVGRTGLSAGFQEWEKAEGERADDLRDRAIKYGLGSALAVVLLLLLRVFSDSDAVADADAVLAAAALSIPAALGGLAVYAGRESSKHRRNETIARRTEIELNSFLPFLAELDPADRDALTVTYTDVFFGQAGIHTSTSKSGGEDGPKPIHREALDKIVETIRRRRPPVEE